MGKRQKLLAQGQPSATTITRSSPRLRQAEHVACRQAKESIPEESSILLCQSESLLEHILCNCGPATPALALSCKHLSGMWRKNTQCQALWLLHNTSSIKVTSSNLHQLIRLVRFAKVAACSDFSLSRQLLWLTWAMSAFVTRHGYGSCKGQHADGSSCCFPLDPSWVEKQEELLQAAASGDLNQALRLLREGVSVQANGNAALRAAAAASHLQMIDLLIRHGADMNHGLAEGGGAFLEACRAGNIPVLKQLAQRKVLQKPLGGKEAALRIAISASNLPVFEHLFPSQLTTSKQSTSTKVLINSQAKATIEFIIVHHRNPMPFIQVCLDKGASRACAVKCLLAAEKWETADSFVRSLPEGTHSRECWTALCEGYMAKTCLDDRWEPSGAVNAIWEAVIECVRRSCQATPASESLWRRIYTFSFSVGGSDSALAVAEEAACHFSGYAEMVAVVKEHRKAGRVVSALRCRKKAMVIQCWGHAAAPMVYL